jgi:hypothetical protein
MASVLSDTSDGNGQCSTGGRPADLAPDQFDIESLRLKQDYAAVGVTKLLTTVPVKKPAKTAFIRTHPSPDYSLATVLLTDSEDRDAVYIVASALRPVLAADPACAPFAIYTAIDRQGNLFLWPVRLPGADGKTNDWWQSAHDAAGRARDGWVRVAANMTLGAYEVWEATGELSEPNWPDRSFQELLRIAFKDRVIDSLDHPALRRLRGEV